MCYADKERIAWREGRKKDRVKKVKMKAGGEKQRKEKEKKERAG